MGFYNVEIPDYVQAMYVAAAAANMTIVQNITTVSLQDLAATLQSNPGDPCAGFYYLLDLIQARNPDFLYGTWSLNTTNLFQCMARRQYRPPATASVTGIGDINDPTWGWLNYGTFSINIWTGTTLAANTVTDPVWGTVSNFNTLMYQYWNLTGDLGYHATVASGPSLLIWSIKQANSLNGNAILAAMDTYKGSLLYGLTNLIPGTRHFNHSYYGLQNINTTTTNLIYPTAFPGAVPAIFPWKLVYPQSFLDSLKTNFFGTATNVVWISILCVFVGIVLIAVVIVIVIYCKFDAVFIPKDKKNAEWGAPST